MTPPRFFKQPNITLQAFWKGSTLQLLSVIILPLALLVLVFATGSTWLHQEEMRMMVGERNQLSARAAAGTLASELHHRETEIQSIAVYLSTNTTDPQNTLELFTFHQEDFDFGSAVFDAGGTLISYKGNAEFWSELELEEDYLGTTHPANSVEAWIEDDPILIFISPSNDRKFFVAGAVSVNHFARDVIANMVASANGSNVAILDPEGRMVFATNGAEIPDLGTIDIDLKTTTDGTRFYKRGGTDFVLAYASLPNLGWTLFLEERWDAITNPSLTTTQVAPLILVPLLILTLAGLWFGARQIVQPLRELERRSAAFVWGDTALIEEPVGGIAEIRELQDELIHMAKMVRSAQRSLRDYIGVITDTQEEERRRLARELHDETLQSIIALKQRVQMARKTTPDDQAKNTLLELETLAEDTIQNVRRITRALRPIYLEDLGLVTALKMLAQELSTTHTIETSFTCHGVERRLTQPAEIAIFRITQETLSNVVRHAMATKIDLSVDFQPKSIKLIIQDNGIGFEMPNTPGAFAPAGHYGLLGMFERADLIGAKLDINTALGQGTELILNLPTET